MKPQTEAFYYSISGFIVGVIITIAGCVLYFMTKALVQTPSPIVLSSIEIETRIKNQGVPLPKSATLLNYHYQAGRDFHCWIGYSAPKHDIEKAIATFLASRRSKEKMSYGFPERPIIRKRGTDSRGATNMVAAPQGFISDAI